MKIKLTYKQASSPQFVQALVSLTKTPMNLKLAYQFKKVTDDVNKLKRTIAKEYEAELVAKYAKKDDQGQLVVNSAMEGIEVDEKYKEEFEKAEEDFGQKEVILDRDQISLLVLSRHFVSIAPASLNALEPIFLDDLETDDQGGNVKSLLPSA